MKLIPVTKFIYLALPGEHETDLNKPQYDNFSVKNNQKVKENKPTWGDRTVPS